MEISLVGTSAPTRGFAPVNCRDLKMCWSVSLSCGPSSHSDTLSQGFLGITNTRFHSPEQEGFSFVELYSDFHTLLLEIRTSPCINGFI